MCCLQAKLISVALPVSLVTTAYIFAKYYDIICMLLSLQKVTDMTFELPADVRALRREIARASLVRSFRQVFAGEPPDYVINDPTELKRAEREWLENHSRQVALLARVAKQALSYLDQQGLEAAVVGFTSSVFTQPELDRFMRNNPYLEELVAQTNMDADLFRALLNLLDELGR
jgi:hypothetical protein